MTDAREHLRRGSDDGEGPLWTLFGSALALATVIALVLILRLAAGLGSYAQQAQEQTGCQVQAATAAMQAGTVIDVSGCPAGGLPDLWELIQHGGRP